MQKVLDGFHTAIAIRLLFDDYYGRSKDPWLFVEMTDQTLKNAVGMHRWNTRHIPLVNLLRGRIDQTHC
jgi:hypothetical protein